MCGLLADYCEENREKTLLIRADRSECLQPLKEAFARLAREDGVTIRLSDMGDIRIQGVQDVVMTNLSTFAVTGLKRQIIFWDQTPTDWYNDAGLLDGLIEGAAERGGHQYFGGGSVTVMISCNEQLQSI